MSILVASIVLFIAGFVINIPVNNFIGRLSRILVIGACYTTGLILGLTH